MLIAKRKSNAQTLIGYKKDFDSNDPDLPTKYYKLKIPNSHEETVKVLEADGESTELLMESYDKLDELRGRVTTQWNAAERFRQLYSILKDEARDAFDEIVDRDYPNNNDKTNANYEELKRKIITQMSDHVNPGDKIVTYLEQNDKSTSQLGDWRYASEYKDRHTCKLLLTKVEGIRESSHKILN